MLPRIQEKLWYKGSAIYDEKFRLPIKQNKARNSVERFSYFYTRKQLDPGLFDKNLFWVQKIKITVAYSCISNQI